MRVLQHVYRMLLVNKAQDLGTAQEMGADEAAKERSRHARWHAHGTPGVLGAANRWVRQARTRLR